MKLRQSPIALAVLGLFSALPLGAAAQSTAGPSNGSLNAWFKAPLNGSTIKGVLNGGTSCYVYARGSVARVAFTLDDRALNTDSTPRDGMQCVLDTTKFANGSHELKAIATDTSGRTYTDVVRVNIDNPVNKAPTVSFTSPSAGQTASGTLAFAASATDDNAVSKVDFFLDGASTPILSDSAAPYAGSLDASKLASGTHTLVARAYDAQGLSATAQVSFNVPAASSGGSSGDGTGATPAPTSGSLNAWFKAPLNGATVKGVLNGGTSCYVNASGPVARVAFSLDDQPLNTDSTPADGMQCVLDTTKAGNGQHKLTAVASDASGNRYTEVISVNVDNPVNKAPTVSFTSPTAGQTASGTIAYAANASDDNGVTKVDFFLDGAATPILSDTTNSYGGSLDTTKLANGSHTLSATAYDAAGLKTTTQVAFSVSNNTSGGSSGDSTGATPAPVSGSLNAWFKAPLNGATVKGVLNGGTSCYVNASGPVARVAFSLDDQPLNTDSTPADGMQCVLDTTKVGNGQHKLTAVASDASGNRYTEVISVNVDNPVNKAPTVSFTSPTAGQTASGSLAYAAIAADDKAVSKVDFFLDGAATPILSDSAAPYGGSLDASKLAAGTHALVAKAYDAEGLSGTAQVAFSVPSGSTGGSTGGSTPGPVSGSLNVWYKAPAAGATISGVLNGGTSCYANTSGSPTRVVFSIDGKALNTDSTPSDGTQCVLDTTKVANGTHQMRADVYDASGAVKTDIISVSVQNATSGGGSTGGDTGGGSTGGSKLPAGGKAVTTFHSAGLYWTPPSNPGSTGCIVHFRKAGESSWRQGLNLWYDGRNNECRGSLVKLDPNSTYEVEMGVGSTYSVQTTAKTWNESFPIARTITVGSQSTLNITEGGTASGYVLYQAAPGAVIDASSQSVGINVNADYVIVRGFTVRGAKNHGIIMQPGRHDIVIENNDVSGWGTYRTTPTNGWPIGLDEESGITARCYNNVPEVYRVVIQRNKVHDPRYGANSWDWGHPAGPNGISMYECGGNNVIRYNEIYSTTGYQHYYMDAIGGGNNDSRKGFPGPDSDIYGNRVQHAMDDAIEAEGGGQNVRVWGNYMDTTAVGIATTPVAIGPIYVFRNVYNRSRQRYFNTALDNDERNNFAKSGSWSPNGNGRRYVLHNTLLQATTSGATYGLGAGGGIVAAGSSEPMTNTVSRNNILQIWKTWWTVLNQGSGGTGNDADYDLYNGAVSISGAESHGIVGVPIYASGNGWQSEAGGMYQLAPSSPGYGKGARIPNFNDDVSAPDIGAHQSGKPAMKFGVNQ